MPSIVCQYCAKENHEDARECERCGALLPLEEAKPSVDLDADIAHCPSCSAVNTTSAEYCTACGTPMAVITRVLELVSHNERGPLETWRVYGIETQMVARAGELELLHTLQERTQSEGETVFVSLRAATGLGKSRLLSEFQRSLDKQLGEALMLATECREVNNGAFHMFATWFKNRFYIAEREPAAVTRRKLNEAVEALLGKDRESDLERITTLLGHLMGLPGSSSGDDDEDVVEDGSAFDRRVFDAVADVLRADSARSPLVIVFEDLQFATNQSLRLLDYLQRNLHDAPILFILSWNPDELYADTILGGMSFDTDIELDLLTDEQVDGFVRQVLHKVEDLPTLLTDKIVESSHGNPLAVEEMLRLLISEGTIDTRQQTWSVDTNKIKRVKLPQTVEATVRARLEALSETEREILRMAACIGNSFWPDLLVCLWRLREDSRGSGPSAWRNDEAESLVEALLEGLERKDIIRHRDDSMLSEHDELFFKHRLERKTIYGGLDSHIKQRYHRVIAQWLDQHVPEEEQGKRAELIAGHFDNARSLERAAHRYIRAADWARHRYANRKAIELYTRGLSYLSDADIAHKLHAFNYLGGVHDMLGEFDQSLAYYRELLRYAWLLNDRNKAGVALNKIGRAYRNLSEFEDALECLDQALEHFQIADDLAGIASTLDDIGKVHWIRARYDEALKYYRAGLALRRKEENKRSIALSLNHIGSLHLQRGELRDAMIYFREALDLRRQVDDRQGVAESFNNLGILCMERGDYPQATTLFEEALEIVREIGYRALEGVVLNNLAETQLLRNIPTKTKQLLEEALEIAEESGEKRLIFDILRNLGASALKRLNRKEALEYMTEALLVAQDIDARTLIGIGHQSLADLHSKYIFDPDMGEDSMIDAERHYRRAIEILTEAGNEAQLGRCLSAYGHFLVEQGEVVQGKQKLEMAREIFKRLEIRKLWDATERVIGEL